MEPNPNRPITPAELAAYLSVPVQTLYRWRKAGTGPQGFRVGRHLRYDPADVDAWVANTKEKDAGG